MWSILSVLRLVFAVCVPYAPRRDLTPTAASMRSRSSNQGCKPLQQDYG